MRKLVSILIVLLSVSSLNAAAYQTSNFFVTAETAELAKKVGDTAEFYRRELAKEWFNKEYPNWSLRCLVTVRVDGTDGGGMTRFNFEDGEVTNFRMTLQGTEWAIINCVVPHEVFHTLHATEFRKALPRWFEEGIATLNEYPTALHRNTQGFAQRHAQGQMYSLKTLLSLMEYPSDVILFYAESSAFAKFLFLHSEDGERKLVELMRASDKGGYVKGFREVYGYQSLEEVEQAFRAWVARDFPTNEEHAAARWVCEKNAEGKCVWKWMPPWKKDKAPAPTTVAPTPDYGVPNGGNPPPPNTEWQSVDLTKRVQTLEGKVLDLERTKDATKKALESIAKSNESVQVFINEYEQNVTEMVDVRVDAKTDEKFTGIFGKLKELKDKKDDIESKVDELKTATGGEGDFGDKVITAIPIIGKWFGLPGFALAALALGLRFVKRRKEGGSVIKSAIKRRREGGSLIRRLRQKKVKQTIDDEQEEIEEDPTPPKVRPTSEIYDQNVKTRTAPVTSTPDVLVHEVKTKTNRYVPVESPDYWKEAYAEALAKEVELSKDRFAPIAQRLEASAAEIHRGKALAARLG